ncbi:MFS transporter [Aquibacillus sp. 3ASR75-11]|uniref:MFS transporter n=1 Tax=Terrihalobacillus insolitus TaxID=2950438 RepID=A0A9X3WT83_9BACI|nr:MFS transporter [Terrihalobacillus insolitus]MDC3412707.1 MFS transporter [Terrihalobacillus insolitus]MDC3423816.1 MFS transporter [Terrihalobacillus insolitus]
MPKEESLLPLKGLLFSFHASNTIIISFLPLYLQYKGLDGKEIGWVLAIGPLAAIISQPFWGYMSDKYQTVKRMLLICIVGLLISSTVFFQMNLFGPLLLMGFVFYFFTSPIGALGDSLAQRRASMLGISFGGIRTWGSIGFATSSLVMGEVLSAVGIEYIMWPYLLIGLAALFVCFSLTDIKVKTSTKIQLKDVKQLFQNRPFFIFLFLIMFVTLTHRTNDSFIGLYIDQLGGSEGLIGLSWFIGVASEALVFALAGVWFRRYHPFVFIIAAGLLYSIRWFIYAAIDVPILIFAFQFMHGLTFGVFYVTAFDYITRLIPTTLQATGHLMFVTVFFGISGIIGSLLGGALIDSFGGGTLYFVLGMIALIGTGLLTVYHILPYGKEMVVKPNVRG